MSEFRTAMGEQWFNAKYRLHEEETWWDRCCAVVNDVVGQRIPSAHRVALINAMHQFKWLPGGRYIYYGGREARFYNNCYILKGEEDTREEWARIIGDAASCLLTGGGIGVDYSIFRERGSPLRRTGGVASGPIPLMQAVNDFGRRARQGGGRRSAIYASLDWYHGDIEEFLTVKDWKNSFVYKGGPSHWQAKMEDFDSIAPLDMTNVSVNYNNRWLTDPDRVNNYVFRKNVEMAMRNGEPGLSFNFGCYEGETGRNACTEVSSSDDSDVCNLASINLARIRDVDELRDITGLVAEFCVCGSMVADVPYEKVRVTRERNRRLGIGIMGLHEWLLRRGYRYEYNPELSVWLETWKNASRTSSNNLCDRLGISRPIAVNAIAPTGTIAGLAGTTSGIEPIFAVAYKRRWLKGEKRMFQFCVDHAAKTLIDDGVSPADIESSIDMAGDVERRLAMQAGIQQHVDMCISSTINLPAWGTELNNKDRVDEMCNLVSKYAPRLRGLTFYPDGSRGGQPLVPVGYEEARGNDRVYEEANDACKDGVCGI